MIKKLFSILLVLFFGYNAIGQDNTFTDPRDNKTYKTVKIGTQTWMAENLKYKSESAVCYNENIALLKKYGYMYVWDEANEVCPKGWHLPNRDEWMTLITYLGGKNKAGGKLKLKGTTAWKAPNKFATNTSGFNAKPSGSNIDGVFSGLLENAYLWGNETECATAYVLYLTFKAGFADIKSIAKTDRACVRCIQNEK